MNTHRRLLFITASVCAVASFTRSGWADDPPPADRRAERLRQLDRDGDGLLAKDELSTQLWERIATARCGWRRETQRRRAGCRRTPQGGRTSGNAARRSTGFVLRACVSRDQRGNAAVQLVCSEARAAESKLPVVLCLHGRGGNTQAALVLSREEMQTKPPCLIIAPGIDGAKERWAGSVRDRNRQRNVMPELIELLDAVIREHAGDPHRIYVTGQSMGGVGTWGLIASHPDRIAAAVPVCGMWKLDEAAKMKSVPVWAFHGADDPKVPVSGSREMIAALKTAGATPKYTEYPGVGHSSWVQAYATAEMWDWMFAQRREPIR